jgi:glycerol-3-phosphate dehydrogenase
MERDGLDMLVIGGGITGAAVAMDAAVRGYRVGLVEKNDFASGTSSKSTKLIHGGLRYLPQLDFSLVREALVERGLLMKNAPWIAQPLGFVLPLYANSRRPLGLPIAPPLGIGLDLIVQSGLMLYDGISGANRLTNHRRLSLREARKRAPALREDGLIHAFIYYDGQTDDCRLTLAVLLTAVSRAALAANYTEAVRFEIAGGRITHTLVRDRVEEREYRIACCHVVNAGGVFAERIEGLIGSPSDLAIAPAKGVHLIFSRETLPIGDDAIVLPETDDGRLLFIIPWEGRVLVGTTDTPGGDIESPLTLKEDVAYLLAHCNRYLKKKLTEADILSSFAGYRPLVSSRSSERASSQLSRSHAVLEGPGSMVSIVGGKLTTWRRKAEDTVDLIAERDGRPHSDITKETELDGATGWPPSESFLREAHTRFGEEVVRHLLAAYGGHIYDVLAIAGESDHFSRRVVSDLPYLLAEVAYACRYEMALTLDDILCRRTHIVLLDRDQGAGVARDVALIMAEELDWDDAEIARQINSYRETVAREFRPHITR